MVVFDNTISRGLADAEGSETSPFEVKSQGLQELGCLVSSFPFSFPFLPNHLPLFFEGRSLVFTTLL